LKIKKIKVAKSVKKTETYILRAKLPEILQLKMELARHIINILDKEGLTNITAEAVCGTQADDISRIRHLKLKGFSIERLLGTICLLGYDVKTKLFIKPKK